MQWHKILSLLLFPQHDVRKNYKSTLTPFTTNVTLVFIQAVLALDSQDISFWEISSYSLCVYVNVFYMYI